MKTLEVIKTYEARQMILEAKGAPKFSIAPGAIESTIKVIPIKAGYVVGYLVPDECAEDPAESEEGIGRFVHWKDHGPEELSEYCQARAVDPDSHDAIEGEKPNPDAVLIDKFEHSGVSYHVAGEYSGPDARWDLSHGWAVWLPSPCLLNELKGKDKKARRLHCITWARQACETFNKWANGDVYGYVINIFDKGGQELSGTGGSCFGFYGHEDAIEGLEEALAIYRKEARKKAAKG